MDGDNLQLSKRINKLDFQDRFSLFEISNFLDEGTFTKLNLSFPDSKFFSLIVNLLNHLQMKMKVL